MTGIFSFAVSIAIIIIIYSLVDSLVSSSKCGPYVKNAMVLIVIVITLSFILNFDLGLTDTFKTEDYKIDDSEIWDETLKHVSKELEEQIKLICLNNGLEIDSCIVTLDTDYTNITVSNIEINGKDKIAAKNLIAGYFKIGSAYINTDGVK